MLLLLCGCGAGLLVCWFAGLLVCCTTGWAMSAWELRCPAKCRSNSLFGSRELVTSAPLHLVTHSWASRFTRARVCLWQGVRVGSPKAGFKKRGSQTKGFTPRSMTHMSPIPILCSPLSRSAKLERNDDEMTSSDDDSDSSPAHTLVTALSHASLKAALGVDGTPTNNSTATVAVAPGAVSTASKQAPSDAVAATASVPAAADSDVPMSVSTSPREGESRSWEGLLDLVPSPTNQSPERTTQQRVRTLALDYSPPSLVECHSHCMT